MAVKRDYGTPARASCRLIAPAYALCAFTLLCVGLIASAAMLLSFSLGVLAFCLLYLPFVFSFTHAIGYFVERKEMPDNRFMFFGFAAYYSRQGFGVYRVLINVAKSLGPMAVAFLLCLSVYGAVANSVDPVFAEDLASLTRLYEQGDADAFYRTFYASRSVSGWIEISLLAGCGAFLSTLAYCLSGYSLSPHVKAIFGGGHFAGRFYNHYYRHIGREYRKAMFTQGFAGALIVPIAFALGVSLTYAFSHHYRASLAIGTAAASTLLSLYIPYYLTLSGEFYSRNGKAIVEAELDVLRDLLYRAQSIPGYDQSQIDSLRKDEAETLEKLEHWPEEE